MPKPIPKITIEFNCKAALIASRGKSAGVVSTTTRRYITIVANPTNTAF